MTASAAPPAARDAEWIVCLGETRIASGGRVPCPLRRGITVLIDACWECHVLAWRSDERDLAAPCTTERTTQLG
jgi:hypothetical protein